MLPRTDAPDADVFVLEKWEMASAEYPVEGGDRVLPLRSRHNSAAVQLKVAISYTAVAQARLNLETELPGWDFDAVRAAAVRVESMVGTHPC